MLAVPVIIRTLLTIQCMLHRVIQLSANRMLDDKLSSNQIKALKQLCPEVDICIWNASEPVVRRNRILEDGRMVSICRGCSCHEDCHDMQNCCFPGDKDTGDDAAASKPLESHSLDSHSTSPSILDNSSDHSLATSEDQGNTSQLDKASKSGHRSTSTKQCLYAQTRAPTPQYRYYAAAYRIVSRAPPGGCITDVPMDRATEEDPCGSGPAAPWGDLYPVISTDHGTIYKNALCARCHGARDFDHMDAVLVCDTYDVKTQREVSSSNHFTFLQQNRMPSFCFISFDYNDRALLQDNRCFVDTVASCPITYNDDSFSIPDGVNITHTEVRNACHSGLSAPVLTGEAYQNAFCVLCNKNINSLKNLITIYEHQYQSEKSFGTETVTYLLDVSFLLENANQEKDSAISTPYPEVCSRNGVLWEKHSCRRLFCPSGQVRDKAGMCMYPSQKWYTGAFSITVKLANNNKSTFVDELLDSGQISFDALGEGFRSASPWPSLWKIKRILHLSHNTGVDPWVIIELLAGISKPSVVFRTLRVAMARPWVLSVDKMNISFKQSMIEYTTIMDVFDAKPVWQLNNKGNESVRHFPGVSSLRWRSVYFDAAHALAFPYYISKLFTCEAVSLFDGEYTLMANNLVLFNNLTGSVMFDKEFDLIEHENGQLNPHVCLSDTPFLLRTPSSCALSLFGNTLPTALIIVAVSYYSI